MQRRRLNFASLLFICVLALGFTHYFVLSVSANCTSTPNGSGNTVDCSGNVYPNDDTTANNDDVHIDSGYTPDSVNGKGGDDTISLSLSNVDGVSGNDGDDSITISNDTRVLGDVNGDDSAAGNDTIEVENSHVYGAVNGGSGNDRITTDGGHIGGNNDVTAGDVNGGEGNDTISVLGTTLDGMVAGGSGNDQITVGATVSGKNGLSVDAGTGNDIVTLVDGANLYNALDGGDGYDVLHFDFHFDSSTDRKAFQKQLDAKDAQSGWIEYNGQTYYWQNFEALVTLLHTLGADNGSSVKITVLGDSRLNDKDVAAPIAVYCTAGAVEVWVINPSDGHGDLTLSAYESTLPQSANGVTVAQNGDQITASFGAYNFSFPAILCPG